MPMTLKDIAQRTGVSIKTVSNVINGRHARVSAETRTRVLAMIEELRYRPNAAAKGLRTKRSYSIGFITDEVASTPYAGMIIKGAQDLAWSHQKVLLIVNTGRDKDILDASVEMMLERRVEGIIYAAMYHRVVQVPEAMREVPVVLLNCYCADRSLPSVVPDEVTGGREATATLLRPGHRRIGFINVGRVVPAAVGRLEGYRQALAVHGVAFDPQLVRSGNSNADSGYRYTMELMRLAAPPTALFCGTDRTAMGSYDALKELGLAIPGDVAVRGFDDQEMIAAYLRPALSTSALPHYAMGEWAVEYLLHQHQHSGTEGPPVQQTIHCPLVDRHSI